MNKQIENIYSHFCAICFVLLQSLNDIRRKSALNAFNLSFDFEILNIPT